MNIKKVLSIMLATITLLCVVATLTACDNSSGEATYTVSVKDDLGHPYTEGIVVQFMLDGNKVAMQVCDENGVATKTLAKADYSVELSFTGDANAFYYDKNAKFTEGSTELSIVLANKIVTEPTILYVNSDEFDAYNIPTGCTYVDLSSEKMSYFFFVPKEAGLYEFSIADGSNAQIGYYGAPHFVQSNNLAEVENNKFSISVGSGMIGNGDGGTSTFVIGVETKDDQTKNCVIGINRVGDAIKTIEDEPWTIYQKTSEIDLYDLPENAEIKEFDLTAATDEYKFVYNEADGFYHLDSVDGPLVLVRLAEDCDYIACFQTILDRSGVTKYFYDEDGKFVRKESYSECLLEYIECVDEVEGVYPLTEDLKYIIQQRGEYVGWWDIESSGYLFKDMNGNKDSDINADIAWLLMCCYID